MVVWPHGMPYLPEIIKEIERNDDFTIVKTSLTKKVSMKKLVKVVYGDDYAPIYHLKSKTRYLRALKHRAVAHVFFEVENPDLFLSGDHSFRHFEVEKINNFKEIVRGAFNPRLDNGEISQNHVIHVSDSPRQAIRASRALGIKVDDKYSNDGDGLHLGIRWPDHIAKPLKIRYEMVPIKMLTARILDENGRVQLTTIEKTPHFLSLDSKDESYYEEYMTGKLGVKINDGQSFQRMLKMLRTKQSSIEERSDPIIVLDLDKDLPFEILDGIHRATVSQFAGEFRILAGIIER